MMPDSEPGEVRRQLQAAGRYLLDNELAWGNAGNISARLSPDELLMTASGTELGALDDSDFVVCPLASEQVEQYQRRPSKELPMHRAVYQMRPEINAVLHASPFYSTMLACSALTPPSGWFVEAMYYLERVGRVPYFHPGSAELGEAVRDKATQANVLLLENHGVLVYDTSVREALMGLHTLEMVCRMLITARNSDLTLQPLPAAVRDEFLNDSGYRPRRHWPEDSVEV